LIEERFGQLLEEHSRRIKSEIHMNLFRQAEKEYLDSLGSEEPEEKLMYTGVPDEHFCFEGRKHQFIDINGERTCGECGLVSGPTHYVSEYGCWDRTRMNGPDKTTVGFKFDSFCQRKGITPSYLFGVKTYEVFGDIRKICDAEEPKRKRLPNLNILTYQVCRRLNIKMDEKLLKIPKSRASHDRCKEIFQTLGWEYIEYGCQNKATVKNPDTTTAKKTVVKDLNMSDIDFRHEGFCKRMGITYSMLSVKDKSRIMEDIKKVHDAEEPKMKSLPNLSILTYQICKRLGIAIDKKLLKIPVSEVPHDRCKKIFRTLGWEYVE
jgi:hypothetical protein